MSFSLLSVKQRKTRERISATFHMSLNGTNQTFRHAQPTSAFRGKRTYTAATSPSDPKQTFRPQILTSIKVKPVAHELSSITVACTSKGGSRGPAAESAALAPPFLSLLHDRRGFCGHQWLAHSAPSLCRGARARNPYQGQCGFLAD